MSVRYDEGVEVTERQRRLLALCAIRVDGASVDWSLIARQAQFEEGLDALWAGRLFEKLGRGQASLPVLRQGIREPGRWPSGLRPRSWPPAGREPGWLPCSTSTIRRTCG